MAVRFYLGASGSGKTTALLQEVIRHAEEHPRQRHLVLVPEQFTFETQRQLLRMHPRHAMLNIEAVSFGHLAARVFRERSAEAAEVLDDTSRQLLLSLAAREAEPELTVYRRQAARPGFLEKLGGLFEEWDMNDLSPERLRSLAAEPGFTPLLQAKLRELALLYGSFKKCLGDGSITAEEILPRLSALLPESELGRGARLYFDGFTGFTAVQYRIVTELMRRSEDCCFAFTLPKDASYRLGDAPRGEADLFAMSKEALSRLARCAEEAGQELKPPVYAEGAPEKPADLRFLEKYVLRRGNIPQYREKPEHIELTACQDAREECRRAVIRVQEAVREQGLRYREIALVVGDTETYCPELESLCAEAGIPCFTDRRAPVNRHPFIRLLEAALEAVLENFERDAVLRYLKNPLSPLAREEGDLYENYLLAAGIRGGSRLTGTYTRTGRRERYETAEQYELRRQKELTGMSELRDRGVGPLLRLKEGFRNSRNVRAFTEAAEAFLEETETVRKLEAQALELEEAGELQAALEWRGVGKAVTELLESISGLLGHLEMKPADYGELLTAGLESLKLGKLPTEQDQLIIGDVERSRFADVKLLLFLGLNEGTVPKPRSSGGLITDRERLQLEKLEPELGYTDEKALLEERFYLYRLMTKPAECLSLSYSARGADGKALSPSAVLESLKACFPALKTETFPGDSLEEQVYSRESAARLLAAALDRPDTDWEALYGLLAGEPDFAGRLDRLEAGALAHYEIETLEPEEAEALYGTQLRGSVTRLEQFARCPYSHFLKYGLGLEPREEFKWEAADRGSFFHRVMELLLTGLGRDGLKAGELDAEARHGRVLAAMDAAMSEDGPGALGEQAERSYLLERWSGIFEERLWAMGAFSENTGFEPACFEMNFGSDLPELRFPLGKGREMRLGGTIDRIDLYRQEDKLFLRVLDYKTSDAYSVDFTKIWHGLQLQLSAYLEAALEKYRREEPGSRVIPGGLYYARLTEPWLEEPVPGGEQAALLKALRLEGLTASEAAGFSGDAAQTKSRTLPESSLRALCAYVHGKMQQLGRSILDGNIAVSPGGNDSSLPCAYCEYSAVCRFDRKIPGTAPRSLKKEKDEDIMSRILEQYGGSTKE